MDPMMFRDKYPPEIRDWWENTLKCPKYVVAPMVDASELAWRMLSRRYKADLCFTPMIHSRLFIEDAKYRAENLFNCLCDEDRPLIVQFCGNDPNVMVEAARYAKPVCDGVDLNLGCPQKIAKNGRYGAFLQDEWDLISTIVRRIRNEVQVPISCKIRIFPDVNKTVEYAKMLERAGCYMLTVHGRTREQKGMDTGLADWSYIKAVRNAVNIPVVANGNIQFQEDVDRCIAETGVEGVMSAEGNLHNPALFAGESPPVWKMGLEYLELVEKYPCPLSFSRGHIFKLYHHLFSLPENFDLRKVVAKADTVEDLRKVTMGLKERYEVYLTGAKVWVEPERLNPNHPKLTYPHYICQPYVRPPKKQYLSESDTPDTEQSQEESDVQESGKRRKLVIPESLQAKLDPDAQYSLKKLKRMARKPTKNWNAERIVHVPCAKNTCTNPQGQKCEYQLCRPCCKSKCFHEELDCSGHKILTKTVRAKARERDAALSSIQTDQNNGNTISNIDGTLVENNLQKIENNMM